MLCCTGPLLLAAAGLSGAALATFTPFRPLFVLMAFASLWAGYRAVDRLEVGAKAEDGERSTCEPGEPCSDPRAVRHMRRALWAATALTVVLTTSPLWDDLLF